MILRPFSDHWTVLIARWALASPRNPPRLTVHLIRIERSTQLEALKGKDPNLHLTRSESLGLRGESQTGRALCDRSQTLHRF
jgi:hypothetical protein